METTKEQAATPGLLEKIIPPRLEDAGLEDCALPPDSIKEAFLKAASAVKSRATSIFADNHDDVEEEEGDCVQDPWPEAKDASDTVIGVSPPQPGNSDALVGVELGTGEGPCVAEKGGGVVEEGRDEVVVGGGEVEDVEKEKGCVDDGVKGSLGIEGKNNEKSNDDDDVPEEEREGERPILTEGFV